MEYKFSQELREEIIWYFEKYHGLTISPETADEFLDSLGEFYLWFNKSEGCGRCRQATDARI
ncbi:MAG TPA: hypothetical protein VK254_03880 [Candidatus Bathyarchaeia archaeon]|nr:hypothetical protein [Candidatus Bathyarchaeia archaeon]